MKNLFFFFIAVFFGLVQQRAAAQCTTNAGTIQPASLDKCADGSSFFNVFHNDNEVLESNDVLKLVMHDGTATAIGNVFGYYSSQIPAFVVTMPAGAVPGVTYQIAAIAGNPDGNGGIDLTDPCLSFNGGVTVTFHAPQVVTVNDPVIGCNEFEVDLNVNITPPGNYQIEWGTWPLQAPQNATTVSVFGAGWYNVYVTDLLSGCWAADTAHVTAAIDKPFVSIDQLGGGNCGEANAVVNVNGLGPHTYLWNDGSIDQTRILTPGTHCVSVTSDNGCVGKDCIVIQEPGDLTASISFVQNENCGQSYLMVEASSTADIVSYDWGSGTNTGNTNFNFSYGENYVTVTDASGCGAVLSYFVDTSPLQCGTLNLRLFNDLDLNCLFNGNDYRLENFKIAVTDAANQQVFYGNSYNYLGGFSWSSKLNPGDYTVSVELPSALWQGCQSSYTVTLSPGTTTELNLPLQAVSDCQDMRLDLAVGELNWCSPNNSVVLTYENKGTTDATNAYIELQLEPHLTINTTTVPVTDLGGDLYRFDLGTVGVGERGYIYLVVKVDCSATIGATPCITGTIFPNAPCPGFTDPDWSGASLIVSSECETDGVHFTIQNVGTAAMTVPLSFVIIEDAVMFMQVPNDPPLGTGETRTIDLPSNGATWRIEVAQEPLHPGFSMPALALEGCESFGSMGFVNQFPPNDGDGFLDIECIIISAAYDPNDKQGLPLGVGEDHLIRPGTDIEYTVRFQNTGNDTANTVVIRDTLDTWLDPLSIEPGAASHPYRFDYYGEGGQIKFTFSNIMLLDSNLNEPASHGFVKFRAKHRTGIPLGTDIFNRAAIYFDYNPPIFTNTTQHRVDTFLNLVLDTWTPKHAGLELGIAPNPMTSASVVEVKGWASTQPLSLELYDALGRQVLRLNSTEPRFLIERNGLVPGVYFLRVLSQGEVLGNGKVVVSE